MVLESLIGPKKAEKKPLELFFLGLIYASIALFFSLWVFREQASLLMVFLTVFAATPLMVKTMSYEEKKDLKITKESVLLKEHAKALEFLMFLFLGFVVALSFWYIVLPESIVLPAFNVQLETIKSINSNITGVSVESLQIVWKILSNNLKVLIFSIIFAFFYGAGAIFILTWNASVIAAAIGTFFRNNISAYSQSTGLISTAGYFHIFSLSLLRYLTHGIFEILAYFMAGLASGIISFAVIKHDLDSPHFKRIIIDSLTLILLAIGILLFAALVEVYITPLLF